MSAPEKGCPTCEVLRDEVAWLREELRALRVQPPAPAPAAPLAGTPGVAITPLSTEELMRQAGIFADKDGVAQVIYDGKVIPLTEWNRGQRAIEQAMAGKPIETEG